MALHEFQNLYLSTDLATQEELESFCVLSSPCLSLEKAKGLSQNQIDRLAEMGIPFTDYKLTLEKTYPTQPANQWSVCIDGMEFGVAKTYEDPRTIVFDNGMQQLIGPEQQGFWVPGETVLGYLVNYAALSVGETSAMVELASDVNAKQIARLVDVDKELSAQDEIIRNNLQEINSKFSPLTVWKQDFGQISAKTVPGAYTQVNIANDLGTSISGIVIGSATASGKNAANQNTLIGINNGITDVSSLPNILIGTANSISKSRPGSYGDTTHVILGYDNYTQESEFGRNSVIMGGHWNSFKIEPDTRDPAFANWKNEYIALGEYFGARQLSGQYRTTTIDIGTNPSKLSASANHILIGTVGQNDTASHRRIGDQCIGITLRDASISSHYDNVPYNVSFEPRTFGDKCITIGVNAQGWMDNSIAIGYQAKSGDSLVGDNPNTIEPDAIAIGHSSWATKTDSIAIGHVARAGASSAIQIGRGRNTTLSSFQVFDYQMLDGNGDIPTARLSASLSSYVPKNVDSVTIGTNASTYSQGVAIGLLAKNTGDSAIAIGRQSQAFSTGSIAIGPEAKVASGAAGAGAAQIGYSSTANNISASLRFRDWWIVDGNGDIPEARVSAVLESYVSKKLLSETISSKISSIAPGDTTEDKLTKVVDALSSVAELLK